MHSPFLELTNQIKEQLATAFESERITIEELLAVLYILGQAEDEPTLRILLIGFAPSFPALQPLIDKLDERDAGEYEKEVHALMSQLLKKDPAKAVQLGKEAAERKSSLEDLKNKYLS